MVETTYFIINEMPRIAKANYTRSIFPIFMIYKDKMGKYLH